MGDTYRVLTGIDYMVDGQSRRAEVDELVDDIPEGSIPWLVDQYLIELPAPVVDAPVAPVDAPVAPEDAVVVEGQPGPDLPPVTDPSATSDLPPDATATKGGK